MEHSDELAAIKKELEAVNKEFNDYKVLIQCKVLPEAETYKYMVRYVQRDLDYEKCINDALLNFIAENGLGEKYYNEFIAEDYPYDVLDFTNKNEVRFSDFESDPFLGKVRYLFNKIEFKN